MLKMINISKSFNNNVILKDINLHVQKKDIYGVLGLSGAGKSTLVRCINGLEIPEEGTIYINNQVFNENLDSYKELRSKMGFVFQHFNLFPNMKCSVIIVLGQNVNVKVLLCKLSICL